MVVAAFKMENQAVAEVKYVYAIFVAEKCLTITNARQMITAKVGCVTVQ